MMRRSFSILSAVFFLAIIYLCLSVEAYVLIPNEAMIVRRIPNAPDADDNKIKAIQKNEVLRVLGCVDYKSDIAVRVRVNGEGGYVSDRDFSLRRESISFEIIFRDPARLVWSCRGFLDNRKIPGPLADAVVSHSDHADTLRRLTDSSGVAVGLQHRRG